MARLFIIPLLISQIYILGVFALEKKEYFVVDTNQSLCWAFTPWTYEKPNWLPDDWRSDQMCDEDISVNDCCTQKWHQFVSGIWDSEISAERSAAEYLWAKWIIEAQSLNPEEYKLSDTITRKEMMKIVVNISDIELSNTCNWRFSDVVDDWGCKYIEASLREWFIASNTNFRPDDTINQAEAIKLIFQSRWLEKRYQTNSWQQDYIGSAVYLWYLDQKPNNYIESATRAWIFQAVARTYNDFQ